MKTAVKEERSEGKKKTRKLYKFRLKKDVAPHFEPNIDFDRDEPEDEDNPRDIEYGPGEVIKTHRRLDKLFVNKFIPLDIGDGDTQSAGGDVTDPDEDPDNERPVRSVEDALVRRGNRHAEEDELKGKPHLQKLAKGGKKTKSMEASDKYGDDVTDQFDEAHDADFVVFKKGDKYTIADADEPAKALKKGLKKSQVSKAITKLAEGDDEEE